MRINYGVSNARKLTSLVRGVFAVIELLIILRAFLIFFSASPSAPFVQWINSFTNPLLRPFVGIFKSVTIGGGFEIEFYSLFALIVYAFVGYIITEILAIYASHIANKKKLY